MAKRVLYSLLLAAGFFSVLPQALGRNLLHFDVVAPAYDLSAHFKAYRILALADSLETLADGEALTIRVASGVPHTFTLKDSKLFAPNHVVSVAGPQGVRRTTLDAIGFDGAYFTSSVLAADEKLVLAQFEGQYTLSLKQGGDAWEIEPLSAYIEGAPKNLYVQYAAVHVQSMNVSCGTHGVDSGFPTFNSDGGGPEAGACKVTELATSCDYTLFQEYGSIAATINRTVTITNLTRADYKIASGLLDEVEFKMVEHYVVTCDTCNPWVSTSVIGDNLTNIRNTAQTLFINTYDLCQHWFNVPGFGSGTVGLAYVGAVCGNFRYNAVMDYTTNTNSMRCMNSHEIGHNFDCNHDPSGSSTIMAPTVSGSTTWSAQSVTEQTIYLPTITCLGNCPTSVAACDTMGVHNLTIRKDTAVGNVVVKWDVAAGYSYRARLYNFSTSSWSAFTTVAAPADSIVFAMPATPCAGKYKVDIMPICTGPVYGGRKQVVFNWNRAVPLTASITASQIFPVCAGSTVNYTATTNATTGISYQWKFDGGNVGSNSPSYSVTATNAAVVNVVVTLSGSSCYTGSPVTSNSITTTTTTSVAPVVTIASTASGTICPTQSVTFTATPTNGGTTPSYQWKLNGGNVGTNSAIYTAASWTASDVITVEMTSNAICAVPTKDTSNAITLSVGTSGAAGVSVAASPSGSVCAAQPVTFTATPTNGGTSPIYQWKKNGLPVGTNSATYSASGWATGDIITVDITSNATCLTSTTGTSSPVTMTVAPGTPPSVSIAALPAGTVCATATVTFTATPAAAGTSPSYQWRRNGAPVGTNSNIYAASGFATGDVVTCRVTSDALCTSGDTAVSNAITMSVTTPTTPVITASVSQPSVCAGSPYTLSVSPLITGATYEWFSGSTSIGTGASLPLTNPAGAHTHYAVATLPSSGCYATSAVTSNTVTANVTAPTVPTASASASATTVCAGTPVTFTATTNVTGGSYQWQVSGGAAGTNSSTFSYTPANGDAITVVVTPAAGSCYSPANVTSAPVVMIVNPLVAPTAALTGDTVLCGSQTRTYTASTNIAAAAWAWTANGAPVAATGATYTYAAANGDILSATAASTGTGCYSPISATASLSMDVATPQVYSIALSAATTPGPGTGTTVTYSAAVAGVSPYVIRWYNFGTHAFSSTIPGWTHVIPAGGKDSVWAWISPVGQLGCFIADSLRSNVLVVNAAPTAIAATAGASGIQVFPNPTHDVLYIRGLKTGDEIRVWNSAGQMVARRVAAASQEEIDVRRWAAGVYVVRVGEVVVRVVRE